MKYLTMLIVAFHLIFSKGNAYELSVCSIFQNESRFMKEWIDFHRSVGIEHFWLYNNNSTDNFRDVLNPYINEGIVELIEWPSYEQANNWFHYTFNTQVSAYNDSLTRSRGKTKWLALIDLDEFIVPVCEYNVIDVLEKHYPHVTGLCINWQMYGTSNIYEIKENESMLQNLMYKMPTNHSTNFKFKSIVRPNFVVNCNNPHFCNYNFPHYHVNANLEKIIIENTGVYIDKIRLNHYWTRDEKYLNEVKIPRAKKWGVLTEENIRKGSIEMNQEEDRIMERFMNKE